MRNELVVRFKDGAKGRRSATDNLLQTIWRFIDSDAKHSYDDILAMDKQIRKMIGRLPKVDAEGNVPGSHSKRKNALAQSVSGELLCTGLCSGLICYPRAQSLIQSGLSAQLVRLHNPYW